MDLSEIAIAFKNCNGETNHHSFKDYKENLSHRGIDFTNEAIVDDANNYILYDCERLLTKAVLNIVSADLMLTKGLFHWSFVSSYYSSFFSIQALNRLQLNFSGFEIRCQLVDYAKQEVKLTKHAKSSKSHEDQFHLYYNENINEYKKNSVDRLWHLGLGTFENLEGYGSEHRLRNAINYYLSRTDKFYYELSLNNNDFNKILRDNSRSPFLAEKDTIVVPPNFAKRAIKIATARIRVLSYVLNYLANYNFEYKSYFERNMKNRIEPIKSRYTFVSGWLLTYLEDWLKFNQLTIEEVLPTS